MDFLIPMAAAADGQASPEGGGLQLIIMLVIFFGIMYFTIIRPQNKRNKEHRDLIGSLQKGDEIVTNGGLVGRITKVEDDFVVFQVADKVELKLQKGAVTASLPKGTIKKING